MHVSSSVHIPAIEVRHMDGTGGVRSSDYYPVTVVPTPTGVGRPATAVA